MATTRIRDAADGRDCELLDNNRFMPLGGEFNRQDVPTDAPVHLS